MLAGRVGGVLVEKLTNSGVPDALAQQLSLSKEVVGQGIAPVPPGTGSALAQAITSGSHAAFMSGLHVSMLVAAFITLIGAGLAPFIKRGKTVHDGPMAVHV